MTEKRLQFVYQELSFKELSSQESTLVKNAIEAIDGSYSPYSHFCVGAALLLESGKMLKGANQENASYPCTTCAERSALNYAQSNFPNQKIIAIAIAAKRETESTQSSTAALPQLFDSISPCGLCRQALIEAEQKQQTPIRLLLVGNAKILAIPSAKDLLPLAFDL